MDPMDNPVSDLSTASNRVQQMQYRVCTEYTLSVSSVVVISCYPPMGTPALTSTSIDINLLSSVLGLFSQ